MLDRCASRTSPGPGGRRVVPLGPRCPGESSVRRGGIDLFRAEQGGQLRSAADPFARMRRIGFGSAVVDRVVIDAVKDGITIVPR